MISERPSNESLGIDAAHEEYCDLEDRKNWLFGLRSDCTINQRAQYDSEIKDIDNRIAQIVNRGASNAE